MSERNNFKLSFWVPASQHTCVIPLSDFVPLPALPVISISLVWALDFPGPPFAIRLSLCVKCRLFLSADPFQLFFPRIFAKVPTPQFASDPLRSFHSMRVFSSHSPSPTTLRPLPSRCRRPATTTTDDVEVTSYIALSSRLPSRCSTTFATPQESPKTLTLSPLPNCAFQYFDFAPFPY